ncbi:MAG: hypothetical protein U1F66_05855 [bacterium]
MKKDWLKKLSLALMVALTLGTVACGSGQDFQNEDEQAQNQADERAADRNGPTEFFNGEGGSVVSDGDFTSVTTGDGANFACDSGGCSLF